MRKALKLHVASLGANTIAHGPRVLLAGVANHWPETSNVGFDPATPEIAAWSEPLFPNWACEGDSPTQSRSYGQIRGVY